MVVPCVSNQQNDTGIIKIIIDIIANDDIQLLHIEIKHFNVKYNLKKCRSRLNLQYFHLDSVWCEHLVRERPQNKYNQILKVNTSQQRHFCQIYLVKVLIQNAMLQMNGEKCFKFLKCFHNFADILFVE